MPPIFKYNTTRTFLASAARGSSGQSNALQVGNFSSATLFLDVTVVTGTGPSLEAGIQFSNDGSTWYDTNYNLTEFNAAGREALALSAFPKYMRVNYTIGGTTPSFTFSITVNLKG